MEREFHGDIMPQSLLSGAPISFRRTDLCCLEFIYKSRRFPAITWRLHILQDGYPAPTWRLVIIHVDHSHDVLVGEERGRHPIIETKQVQLLYNMTGESNPFTSIASIWPSIQLDSTEHFLLCLSNQSFFYHPPRN